MSCFSLTNFKIFALSLTFNSLAMHLGVAIILFILIAVHWTLISKLIFFFKFRKKICPLFLQIFFLPLNSFLSFWDSHYTYTGMLEPTDLWDSACLPWFFFSSFFSLDNFHWSIFMFAESFFCQLRSSVYSSPMTLSFQLFYYSMTYSHLVLFSHFCVFIDILYLMSYWKCE